MKGPPGYDIGDGNCLSMLKCIYGLVQAPRQYYMLCREVYQKAGMKHLQTDECVFTRYVYNSIGQPSLATGLQPCSHWFSTLPQLVLDLAATGFRPCRNWFSTLQQLVFDLAATGFSTLQQLVFNLAATNSRPYRNWRLCCNTGYLGHGKYPSQLRSWCKNLRSLSNKMVA